MLGSTTAARTDPLREARADPRSQGQDGVLDGRAGAARRSAREHADRPGHRGVARAHEAREHVPRAPADADRRGRATAHDVQPDRRGDRPPLHHRARTCRRSPSAPSSAGRSARPSSPSRDTGCSRPTTRRSSCGSSRTSPGSRSCARPSPRRGHPHRDGRGGARQGSGDAHEGRAEPRQDDQLRDRLRDLGVRPLREPRASRSEQAQAYIDAYLARFPHVQAFIARTIAQAGEDGYATSLLGRRRPVPELRASNRQTRGVRRAASRSTS